MPINLIAGARTNIGKGSLDHFDLLTDKFTNRDSKTNNQLAERDSDTDDDRNSIERLTQRGDAIVSSIGLAPPISYAMPSREILASFAVLDFAHVAVAEQENAPLPTKSTALLERKTDDEVGVATDNDDDTSPTSEVEITAAGQAIAPNDIPELTATQNELNVNKDSEQGMTEFVQSLIPHAFAQSSPPPDWLYGEAENGNSFGIGIDLSNNNENDVLRLTTSQILELATQGLDSNFNLQITGDSGDRVFLEGFWKQTITSDGKVLYERNLEGDGEGVISVEVDGAVSVSANYVAKSNQDDTGLVINGNDFVLDGDGDTIPDGNFDRLDFSDVMTTDDSESFSESGEPLLTINSKAVEKIVGEANGEGDFVLNVDTGDRQGRIILSDDGWELHESGNGKEIYRNGDSLLVITGSSIAVAMASSSLVDNDTAPSTADVEAGMMVDESVLDFSKLEVKQTPEDQAEQARRFAESTQSSSDENQEVSLDTVSDFDSGSLDHFIPSSDSIDIA